MNCLVPYTVTIIEVANNMGEGKMRKRNGRNGMAEAEQRVKRGIEGKTRKSGTEGKTRNRG